MKKLVLLMSLLLCAVLTFAAAEGTDPNADSLMMYLTFDEGEGLTVHDASGNLPDTDMNYGFSHAVYMDSQDPQWREDGISGGCLLLDGATTYVQYKKSDIKVSGSQLTISVWIAPRTFEWDDPNAADNGTDQLTGIVSQSVKADNQGFILGYERFGRVSFQVGTGDEWLTLWTNGDNLIKYAWNQITAVFDGEAGEMIIYLNGELVASRSVPVGSEIQVAKNRTLVVGRNVEAERLTAGFEGVASGYIDEVKLYSCALTEDDVYDLYDNTEINEIAFSDIWLQNLLGDDYTKTQYHGGPYQFWMNEPHAPVYYNGKYHLFYQANMTGSYWRNICWGHLVSDDMVNWKPIKEAITPTEYSVVPDGVWSGNAAYDKNGVPLLFFTAGNDAYYEVDGLISNQNIGVAYPTDLTDPELTEWKIADELAVIQQAGQGRTGEFRDPYVWQDEDGWYMLICSGSATTSGGSALLYKTATLELLSDGTIDQDWQYIGPIYEMEDQSTLYGTSWELPILMPVSNSDGSITKYMFVFSPAPASIADNKVYYFLGDFDKETGKFTPDESFGGVPRMFDYGCNVFTGPSAMVDPVSGEIVMFSIMQDQRGAGAQGASGWAHSAGLTRVIRLLEDGSDLAITPLEAVNTLEEEVLVEATDLTLDAANELLAGVSGDMLHVVLKADISNAATFGIDLKKGGKWDNTTYYYTVADETIHGETENRGDGASTSFVSGALPNADGTITMDIYIDRSLVEAFFNEYKALTIRAYVEDETSQAIDLYAEGEVTILSLHVATMGSIYD